jgi:DNA protecting protein DprA
MIDRELEAVRQKGFTIVTLTDRRYPPLLRQIPDPPPFLYVYGLLPATGLNIAVVGSRNATAYGIATTRQLCMDLARQQVNIVSGMARGVDTAAHSGAIAAGGVTVSVLGTGLNRIYPRENTKLFHQIAENGAWSANWPSRHRSRRAPFSGPQPHHQRHVPRHGGGGGHRAKRFADHRPPGRRAEPGGLCRSREHPLV